MKNDKKVRPAAARFFHRRRRFDSDPETAAEVTYDKYHGRIDALYAQEPAGETLPG
jgi:hypothetical protein